MPLSAASINRASYQVLLLLAAAAVSTTGGDGNTAPGNATATATTGGDDTEMYICYLCTGRNPILIRRCPIYWDYCHLNCFDDAPSTAAAADDVAAVPVASPAAPARRVGGVPRETLEDEECYVMKLYENGSYVIVTTLGCSQTASCLLSCGGGDLAADGEEALAAAHPAGAVGVSPPWRMWDTKFGFPPAAPPTTAAAAQKNPKRRREAEAEGEVAAEMREEAVERLRGVVRDSVGKHLYASAIFLADKVAAATGDPADVYMLAQALFLGRHFRRALHILNSSKLLRDLRFRFLAAKCLEELKEWHQCLIILGDAKIDEHGNVVDQDDGSDIYFDKDAEDHEINIKAAICFLRGKAYEALDNCDLARQWYKAAVKADPLCYEALECLVDNYMLTCEEESELLSSLKFGKEDGWLSAFYSCLIRKHEKEYIVEAKFKEFERESCSISSLSSGLTLKNNIDVLACKAEYYHQSGEYQKCFELTSALLERDPFHLKCTLVHLAAAMELGHSNDLYILACNLVKDYPQKALSWFAVGCYYYCIKKYDQARRYFGKATGLDGTFPPAWIGTGIAYAAQEEGDQAMAAFRTAARLFPGCHLPTLYMGMQYLRMHNFKLAEQFFTQAKSICPSDPLIYNEMGVVAYNMKEYQKAVQWFELTLEHTSSSLNEMWEPTLVNLGHALRKLKKYQKAISYYEKALTFQTKSLSAFAGLAYTYHLMAMYHVHRAEVLQILTKEPGR
uniref:TPR Domain containing protein, expressed n=1 Tax=Oryza sativa subsp. japonica TaxID=39947 RepID=Q10PF0_ORYSJ|nr:TPR Domain containing protein, expressed [Oryza sativa Japonica Group]